MKTHLLNILILRGSFVALASSLAIFSCVRGPGFLKQEGSVPLAALDMQIIVPSLDSADGSTTAKLTPSSDTTQIIQANANSAIAGAFASFPPGSLAVETDVTLAPAASLAAAARETDIGEEITVLSEAPAVAIASTVGLSTDASFTVNIPLPASTSLHQLGLQDIFANLAVIYRIERDGQSFVGAFPRDQLILQKGFVSLVTRFFGTYQAVLLATPLKEAREVATNKPVEPEVKPQPETPRLARRIFARGFLTSTLGSDSSSSEANVVAHGYSPALVGGMNGLSIIQTGFVSRVSGKNEE